MKGKTGNYRSTYGGPTKSYVPGVQTGNHSNPKVMKIAEGTENRNTYAAGGRCGMAEGGSSRPRLDRPGRKMGGKVKKKADGGDVGKAANRLKAVEGYVASHNHNASVAANDVERNMRRAVNKIGDVDSKRAALSGAMGKPLDDESSLFPEEIGNHTLDRKRGGKIPSGFIKHPGALRKSLNVKEGEKIPAKKLEKAEHSDNPKLRKRAVLAETMKQWHHGKKG